LSPPFCPALQGGSAHPVKPGFEVSVRPAEQPSNAQLKER
jgi:hypothetical protein